MPFNMSRSNTPATLVSQVSTRTSGGPRPRRMSENFYEEGGGADIADGYRTPVSVDTNDQVKKYHTRQSKKLPHWAWRFLVTILDIKQAENDKSIIGKIVFVITAAFALVFTATYIWYTVYDIYSEFTKSTALTGTVAIVIVLFYCGMGLYAHRLARNLFRSKKLVESVRLHSKTIFKISASFLLILIGVTIVTMNNLSAHETYSDERCRNVTLSIYVCRTLFASRVGYSILNLFWNLIVGFVVLSVCRTHTIGIRRFIRELEDDGRVYEQLFRQEIIGQLQQLQRSGEFSASMGQSTMYTAAEDTDFLSSRESEEDPWAEDDPLVEELSFFPRPSAATRVQMAQYQNSGGVSGITGGGLSSLGKRRMLMKQASVSSINRNQSERSYGVYNTMSRHNSISSQEDDVFNTETIRQTSPRHLLSPLETLVERSTENLNTESTPLNPGQTSYDENEDPETYYQGYGAIGGKPNSHLERHLSEPVTAASHQRDEYKVAGSESMLRYSEDTLKPCDENVDSLGTTRGSLLKVNVQEMKPMLPDLQITEDYFDNDTDPLIKSVSDNEGLYHKNAQKTNLKRKKVKRRHSKSKGGNSNSVGSKSTESRSKEAERHDGKKGGVDIGSVIDSLERRKSVEGQEREMKEKLLAYISSQSSEDEDVKVRESCHGDNTRPLDQMSMETWDQDNLLLTNEEIFLAYWKISCRLRATSLALQRWLVMWVFFILLWCAAFLVELVSHDSKVVEIGQFILTILLIPLVCSAYGEVNNEGSRLIKAFGFNVSYATIVKTLGALGLAFFTKLLLDDMDW